MAMKGGMGDPCEGTTLCPDSSHMNLPVIKLHRHEYTRPSVCNWRSVKEVYGSHQRQIPLVVLYESCHALPMGNPGEGRMGSLWIISHNCIESQLSQN